ncbi:MAG: hypothetical protein VB934_17350 [Polyangiaceae bacterium]
MKWIVMGVLCLGASAGMFVIGSNSSHLTELKDFFWAPLPLAVILLIVGAKQPNKSD